MRKSLSLSVFILLLQSVILFSFVSCKQLSFSTGKEELYGSLEVYAGTEVSSSAREIYRGGIKSAIVTVSGYDSTGKSFEKSSDLVEVSGGKASEITVKDIPLCKNAVVFVQAYGDSSAQEKISGITISAVTQIKSGSNQVTVNASSTLLGNLYKALLDASVNTNALSDTDIASLENAIPSSVNYALIDYSSIASDYKSLSLKDSSSYKMDTVSVSFTASDVNGYTIQVGDPVSSIKTVSSDSETFTLDVAPGKWTIYALDSSKSVKQSALIEVTEGDSPKVEVKKSSSASTSSITLYVPKDLGYDKIYYWGGSDVCSSWAESKTMSSYDDTYYTYTINSNLSKVILRSSTSSSQTNDLYVTGGAYKYIGGSSGTLDSTGSAISSNFEEWTLDTEEKVSITINGTSANTYKVHLRSSSWSGDHYMYAYTGSTAIGSAWPGDKMEEETNGYLICVEYALPSVNLIFNNNSSQYPEQNSAVTVNFPSDVKEAWFDLSSKTWSVTDPDDSENPTVVWVSPAASSTLTGVQKISVNAFDNNEVSKVEVYLDDSLLTTLTTSYSYSWDTSDCKNGTHVLYAKAYDAAGNTATTSKVSVTTSNTEKAPVAVITSSSDGVANVSMTFDASSSTGFISTYKWDFGDNSTLTGQKVSHTYTTDGTYTVKLTVTTESGLTSSAQKSITVEKAGSFTHRDFREENVYFLLTDRFADGDSTNNNIWGDEYLPNGTSDLYTFNESKTGVLSYYHGGDFKGIINNLDYIADMGFTAIWITPSVKQPEGRFYNGGDYEASAFHGYWGYDFDQIDPHLHSSGKDSDGWDDYKAFIQACHAKGIRVMQDIVLNHGNHTSAAGATKWKNYSVQTIMDGKEWAWKTLDPYYESDTSKNGFYSYYGFGQCSDLIDFGHLGEDGKDSRQHLINVYKKFIDAGVDAFRIDTIAYIPSEFAGEFADAMYNYAKSKGNDYFYMIGEAWCGRHDAVDRHSKDTTDSLHMLDMHLSCLDYPGQMQGVFKDGGDFAQYNNATNDDSQFSCMTPEEYTKTAMFVDNHDCYRNEAIYSESQYKNALNYIYIFRGVPIVFYGTEAMYSWSGTNPTTNKDDVVSRWMLGDVGINYVKNNQPPMYKHLKVLNEIRSNSPCIQKGEQENLVLSGNQAVFTRTYNGKVAYVGLNTSSKAYSYNFTVNSGTYKLISCSSDGTYSSSTITASGTYSLSVPGNGFAFIEQQ